METGSNIVETPCRVREMAQSSYSNSPRLGRITCARNRLRSADSNQAGVIILVREQTISVSEPLVIAT